MGGAEEDTGEDRDTRIYIARDRMSNGGQSSNVATLCSSRNVWRREESTGTDFSALCRALHSAYTYMDS